MTKRPSVPSHSWALAAIFACWGLCSSTDAIGQLHEPLVFLGELQSITLATPDSQRMRTPDAEGRVTISNSCGDETAMFRVIRSNAPLLSPQTLHFTIGEWCVPPIDFGQRHWLIISGAESDGDTITLPVLESRGTAFALVRDERVFQRDLPAPLRAQLPLRGLPEPVEYNIALTRQMRQFISQQSSLEIRHGKVWIVRGIYLSDALPSFSPTDLD